MTTPKPTPNNLAFLTIPVQDWGAFFVEDVTLVGCVCLCVCVCMCVCVCVCACQMKVMVGDSGLCCCVPCHAQWCQLSDSDALCWFYRRVPSLVYVSYYTTCTAEFYSPGFLSVYAWIWKYCAYLIESEVWNELCLNTFGPSCVVLGRHSINSIIQWKPLTAK